jgi:hypothetical protein
MNHHRRRPPARHRHPTDVSRNASSAAEHDASPTADDPINVADDADDDSVTDVDPRWVRTKVDGHPDAINVGDGPAGIRALSSALDAGLLPDTYVSDGDLVHMETVSGGAPGDPAVDEDAPLPIAAAKLTTASLALLLAHHSWCYKDVVRRDTREIVPVETIPSDKVLAAVLSRRSWPGVQPLVGIIGAPVLRRDGTLLQQAGYDPTTGLYLATRVRLDPVPDKPTPQQVHDARVFLLDKFLRDFPWASMADLANYVALLVTPTLRRYLRSLIPFGLIDATMPASGKSLLCAGPGMLYGQRVLPWPDDDDNELRKAITAVLADLVGCIVWDNITEGTVIDSAVLANLITNQVWSDRLLGTNRSTSVENDRLWMATGNNLQLGGDMASRTVRVHLDPDMPRPEERDQTKFGIPNLDHWITRPENQRIVLGHLLVLILDWIQAGAPRDTTITMRQFTQWAQALGGFLNHHGIHGFLTNAADVRGIDEDESRWRAFLATWHERHGPKPLTAAELRADYEPNPPTLAGVQVSDPWDGTFITTDAGRTPNTIGLGRYLTGQTGRWRGPYVIRSDKGPRGDRNRFWVDKAIDTTTGSPGHDHGQPSPHPDAQAPLPLEHDHD